MPIIKVEGNDRNYNWGVTIEKGRGHLRIAQCQPENDRTDVVLLSQPQIDALRELLKCADFPVET